MKPIHNTLCLKIALAALAASTAISSSFAVPAKPGAIDYCQPDGSTICVRLHGDETLNWYTDLEGNPLRPDSEGRLVPASKDWLAARLNPAARFSAPVRTGAAPSLKTATKNPGSTRPALVILVQFPDKPFSFSRENFSDMLSLPGYAYQGAAGSARDYFIENSYGLFSPRFDVYGPVTMENPMSYYGANDDALAHKMVAEAIRQLDSEVDFSIYDANADGWIDNIYIFYAGYGEADGGGANTVWPHSSNLYAKGEIIRADGVMAGNYACSNELVGNSRLLVGTGTFCHEYCHVLGLPDLYPTNGSEIDTPYYWSLMEHGNYNGNGRCPAALTAYEREFLGWLSPVEIYASDRGTLLLPDLSEGLAYKVPIPGDENQWYMLEYRSKTGWDASLPAEGLLIWRIDYDRSAWDDNRVNNDPERQRVDLVEAGGNPAPASSASHPFPGSAGVTSFEEFAPRFSLPLDIRLRDIRLDRRGILLDLHEPSSLPEAPPFAMRPESDDISIALPLPEAPEGQTFAVSIVSSEQGRPRPLAPYTFAPCGAGSSEIVCTGAEPETEYSIRLRSRSGIAFSEPSAPIVLSTASPLFGGQAPTALDATDVSPSGFVANWTAIPDADSYLLSIFSLAEGSSEDVSLGFDEGNSLPEEWESNVATAMSVTGYYGQAAPSLRMTNNADYLRTPFFDKEITSLSFWMRGYKLPASARLRIEAFSDGVWSEPVWESSEISNSEPTTVSIDRDALPEGTVAIRFVVSEPAPGSLCLDDILIGFGTQSVREYILEEFPVGDVLSYRVDNLPGGREYRYMAAGAKGDRRSEWSNEVAVLQEGSSVAQNFSDSSAERPFNVFTPSGICIGNSIPESGGIYIIRYPDGTFRKTTR